jgi:hypothetical protein
MSDRQAFMAATLLETVGAGTPACALWKAEARRNLLRAIAEMDRRVGLAKDR